MSIESRSRQFGVVFDHWQVKEFLGQGSGGKTAVFRLSRADSSRGESALKVVSLIEERGSIEALSPNRRREYEEVRQDCTEAAEKEVWLMNDMQGNSNIVDYLDHTFVDWSDETGFGRDMLIRMELLRDLRGELSRGREFTREEILKIGRDICSALELCHSLNIIHRDIKPENIFINKNGNYKLGDFGVARMLDAAPGSMASTNVGTAEYAAPEQFMGMHDHRVDIYSLGLVLYELSNHNCLPFAESSYVRQQEITRRIYEKELPAPRNADPLMTRVILRACANNPDERYQTAHDFLRALNAVANAGRAPAPQPKTEPQPKLAPQPKPEPQPAPKAKTEPKLTPPPKKKRSLLPVAIVLICLLLPAGGYGIYAATRTEPQPVQTVLGSVFTMAEFPYTEQGFWGQGTVSKSQVESIRFVPNQTGVPAGAWDVSARKDSSILAWMNGSELTVAANGRIAPAPQASSLFRGFTSVKTIDFGGCFDTSGVTQMREMFCDCPALVSLDLSGFDTSAVQDMTNLFYGCRSLEEVNLSSFDTSSVIYASGMFQNCSALKSLDLSHYRMPNAVFVYRMFYGCRALAELNLSGLSLENARQSFELFDGCSNLASLTCLDSTVRQEYASHR